jgi:AcrR family transcriptional regulator
MQDDEDTAADAPASDAAQRPGRPRSDRAQQAILHAAAKLLRKYGLQGLTVDAVVAEARVSKTTVYRWWGSKHTVAMDAILQIFNEELDTPDTGSVHADLYDLMKQFARVLQTDGLGYIYVSLLVEAQQNAEIEEFHRRFFTERRAILHGIIQRGVTRQELAATSDADFIADALFGPIIFRLLTGIRKVDDTMIGGLLDSVLCSPGRIFGEGP